MENPPSPTLVAYDDMSPAQQMAFDARHGITRSDRQRCGCSALTVTVQQAEATLLPGTRVHTFQRSLGWAGADVDRHQVIAAIRAHGSAEIVDPATSMGHELAVPMRGVRTYLETDPVKVAILRSQPTVQTQA